MTIEAELNLNEAQNHQIIYRLTSPKGKDYMGLWLHHLFAHIALGKGVKTTGCYFQDKNKRDRFKLIEFNPISLEQAKKTLSLLLDVFKQGMSRPLFVPAQLALQVFTKVDRAKCLKPMQQVEFENLWSNNQNGSCLYDDPTVRFFYSTTPEFKEDIYPLLSEVYLDLFLNLNPNLLTQVTGTY
jgi:exonuclease V gamma subunit